MSLQALLILEVILEEDLFLRFARDERILNWRSATLMLRIIRVLFGTTLTRQRGLIGQQTCLPCIKCHIALSGEVLLVQVVLAGGAQFTRHARELLTGGHGGLRLTSQANGDVAETQSVDLHIVIIVRERWFCTSGHGVPTLTVFIEVKVFAPFDQIVHFIIEMLIIDILELFVIKWIIVERFKLLLESG